MESGYYYYVDKTTEQRIRVQRSLGDPIYQYKKGLEVTLGIDAKNLKVFCDQYTKNESGLLDYVIEQSGMGDDGIYKTETRTAFENGNINAVMDGDIDGFINAFLAMKAQA